jgi:hypothetical protein
MFISEEERGTDYELTKSMEHSPPREDNNRSDAQKINSNLWC